MTPIELLAPAKDLECGLMALSCGADAVYIGAEKFGARKDASNSLQDIQTLVQKAHRLGSKVYVTINTILTDKELVEAKTLISHLYEIGVDALLIQDMGLLEIDLPPIALFASTQTDNVSPEKIQFLEKVGFQRAVLARELSLEEIQKIRSQTKIELETFVHGAICVSYSGRCYLSLALGGKSANRGECAQPCRKKYSLKDGAHFIKKEEYLLSQKDLNLSNHLENLLSAGISSFKIEGRLKNLLYVKNTVSFYRKKLDVIFEKGTYKKSSSGTLLFHFEPDLEKSYTRGYTDYFLFGKNNDTFSKDSPKPIGSYLGTVKKIGKESIEIDTKETISNGDGLAFFDPKKDLQGMRVDKVDRDKIFVKNTDLLKVGDSLYRNHDHLFIQKILKAKVERRIGISLLLFEQEKNLCLQVVDEDGIKSKLEIKNSEKAKDQDLAKKIYQEQLSKVGEQFVLQKLTIDPPYLPFLPLKELNALRRDLLEQLLKKRELYFFPKEIIRKDLSPIYIDKKLSFEANVLNNEAKRFYEKHGVEEIEPALEKSLNFSKKKVVTMKSCLFCQIGPCSPGKKLSLIDSHGKEHLIQCNREKCQVEIFFK